MTPANPIPAQSTRRGRALCISARGWLYVSSGYGIYRSEDEGATWVLDCRVPASLTRKSAQGLPLAARLLRLYVQALQVLDDGTRVAVVRDGIYRAAPGEVEMRRTWSVTRGSRPINISQDGNRLLFGEYGGREMDSVGVRLYCSTDAGRSFEICYEFPKGDVHHIHNVVVDPYADHYWVLAGDHGRTPGIAALSKDGRHLDWVQRGSQMVRACSVLCRPDCLLYGSDSEMEQNYVVRLDRKRGLVERLAPLEGSSLYAADYGSVGMISTAVEPSRTNTKRECCVYASADGARWDRVVTMSKDRWHPTYFQFGLVVLPYVHRRDSAVGLYSGQAVRTWHDLTTVFRLPVGAVTPHQRFGSESAMY